MPKIRLQVNKLEDATADYVSLVHRSASRIPFRITKAHPHDKEQSMINIGGKLDLADLRTVLKSDGKKPEDNKPVLLGLVVEKGDYLTDEVKAELKAVGIDVEHPADNDDDTVTFVQGDQPLPEETTVLKMSEHALALLDNIDADSIVKGTPFADLYDEAGFLLSPVEISEGLQTTIKQASDDSTLSAAERTKQIAENTAAAYEYMQRIAPLLPEAVTKADEIICKACAAAQKGKPDGQAKLDGAATTQKADDKSEETKKAEADAAATAAAAEMVDCPACLGTKCNICDTGKVTKAEAETLKKAFPFKRAQKAESQEVPPAATMQAMDAATLQTALSEALAPVQKGIADLATEIGVVKKAQEQQDSAIKKVEAEVQKADKVLKSTLIGGAATDDRPPAKVVKAEGELGNLDTAYAPQARRVQKGYGTRMQELQRIKRT